MANFVFYLLPPPSLFRPSTAKHNMPKKSKSSAEVYLGGVEENLKLVEGVIPSLLSHIEFLRRQRDNLMLEEFARGIQDFSSYLGKAAQYVPSVQGVEYFIAFFPLFSPFFREHCHLIAPSIDQWAANGTPQNH
jgi:hypothetical protein